MPQGFLCRLEAIRGVTKKATLPKTLTFEAFLGDLEIAEEFKHAEYETISDGDFSVPSQGDKTARPLRSFDFEALTFSSPQVPVWAFASHPPGTLQARLLTIGRSREPVNLWIQKGSEAPVVNRPVTIRGVTERYAHGQPEVVYLSIQTREFRAAEIEALGAGKATSRDPDTPNLPAKHKLAAGDTLASLSRRYYGTYKGAPQIGSKNNIKNWGNETPLIGYPGLKVGGTITIPDAPFAQGKIDAARYAGAI